MQAEFPFGIEIIGEEAQLEFIRLYSAILRLRNTLSCFDEFADKQILDERTFQDYQSIYIDLYQEHRKKNDSEKENINEDIIFEVELIKQISITIDYILMLVKKYADSNCQDKTILVNIGKSINASIELRSKKTLIENFIEEINATSNIDSEWQDFVQKQKEKELATLIEDEQLKEKETIKFITNAFRDGTMKTTGIDIDNTLPSMSRFANADSGQKRAEKKQRVLDKLLVFFEKYFGLV